MQEQHQQCKRRLQQVIDELIAEGNEHTYVLTALTELTMMALEMETALRKR